MFTLKKIVCLCIFTIESIVSRYRTFLELFRFFSFLFSPGYFNSISHTAFKSENKLFALPFHEKPHCKLIFPGFFCPQSLVSCPYSLVFSSCLPTCWWHYQMGSPFNCTAKTQYRKFETKIPRKGIARPQSQFPHSCVCERFIHILRINLPILLQENMWTDPGNI